MTAATTRQASAIKTVGVLLLFLGLKAGGNSFMAWGMKHVPERVSMNPVLYIHAMANPVVALGVFALALSLLTRMALFSLADLSFVLPVTAIGYVFAVLIGKLFLAETVSGQRWMGTALIFLGAVLVGTTRRNTTGSENTGSENNAR